MAAHWLLALQETIVQRLVSTAIMLITQLKIQGQSMSLSAITDSGNSKPISKLETQDMLIALAVPFRWSRTATHLLSAQTGMVTGPSPTAAFKVVLTSIVLEQFTCIELDSVANVEILSN